MPYYQSGYQAPTSYSNNGSPVPASVMNTGAPPPMMPPTMSHPPIPEAANAAPPPQQPPKRKQVKNACSECCHGFRFDERIIINHSFVYSQLSKSLQEM